MKVGISGFFFKIKVETSTVRVNRDNQKMHGCLIVNAWVILNHVKILKNGYSDSSIGVLTPKTFICVLSNEIRSARYVVVYFLSQQSEAHIYS